MLVQLLVGMSREDARRLVRQAINDDGAITIEDTARVLRQKHEAMGADAMLSLELDVAKWDDVAGLTHLKRWLNQRRSAFTGEVAGLEPPRGVMLLGVQGSGKSLAARAVAVAGAWRVPLLRLDFGVLYSKWIGETERNLRDALQERRADGALRAVDRRDREGHQQRGGRRRRIGRLAPHARHPAHLDGGTHESRVPRGHGQCDRAAPARTDPQGAHRRDLLRGPARTPTPGPRSCASTCAAASRRPTASTWPRSPRRPRGSPARRSSRPSSPPCTRATPRGSRSAPITCWRRSAAPARCRSSPRRRSTALRLWARDRAVMA